MVTGAIQLALQTVRGFSIDDMVQVRLSPATDNAGGQSMRTPEFAYRQAPGCRITNVVCQGSGTEYIVHVEGRRYRSGSFIHRVVPEEQTMKNVRLFTDPGRVRDIEGKAFSQLDTQLQAVLGRSEVPQFQQSNGGGFLTGERLYGKLDSLRKACLLNVWCKASHASSDALWQHVNSICRLEQDRIFAFVTAQSMGTVAASAKYTSVSPALHTPLPGFELRQSFKTRDERANLQVTFMENPNDGRWAADIDIDESTGAGHIAEVFRNSFGGKTHPYTVCELLFLDKELEPPYQFVF